LKKKFSKEINGLKRFNYFDNFSPVVQ
jgi:hypothetical protein